MTGTVRRPIDEWFLSKILPDDATGCWLWTGVQYPNGYGLAMYAGEKFLAHRVSYAMWRGPIPNGMVVRHSCDNKQCVNPHHLEIGTVRDNTQETYDRGLINHARGERHGGAKLTDADVTAIRAARSGAKKVPLAVLAAQYRVDESTISRVAAGKLWRTT